jgi:hypothetical protein
VLGPTTTFVTALVALAAAGPTRHAPPNATSRPDHVSAHCRSQTNSWACGVALRYLAALDLDRSREACSLLEPETLEAAGSMAGCRQTLATARGIRIRYSILSVGPSPFGRTIFFSTTAASRPPIRQAMIVTPRRRIFAIAPVP